MTGGWRNSVSWIPGISFWKQNLFAVSGPSFGNVGLKLSFVKSVAVVSDV